MSAGATGATREYGRSVGLLTVSLAAAGLLAYVFFAVASHTLDRDDYGRIVVLWSAVFLVISVLFRPIEQLLTRTVAELDEHDRPIRHALRVAAIIQIGLGAAFLAVGAALHGSITDTLFDGEGEYTWLLIASVLTFSGSYFARGYLAGSRRMALYGALLVVDGLARLGFALAVAVGLASGPEPLALGIAIAPILSLSILPFALGRSLPEPPRDSNVKAPSSGVAADSATEFTLAQGGGFATAVLAIMVSEQVILNGGPLLAQAERDAVAAGFIFNVLMVARAPIVLFQAVAASLLPHLTRLRARDNDHSRDAFVHSLHATLGVVAVFAALTCVGLLIAGPTALQLAFGDKFTYGRFELVLVGAGMGLYLAAATLNQAALANGRARTAAWCWLAAAATFVIWNLLATTELFLRIELGFTLGAALLCLLLYITSKDRRRDSDEVPLPGSPAELQLRAAAADEVA